MAGARGTELDTDFVEMERKIDAATKMVDELIDKMREYLQPNPMARARLFLHGRNRSAAYPQPEGVMGECMVKHGKDFGEESPLGAALSDLGEAYRQMAEVKYSLEDNVKQNFLDPFTNLQERDLKEISHHRKKLEGRRLDYDCKKRRGSGRNPEEELAAAEEKFVESKTLAENAMVNFLNSDTEQLAALCELAASEIAYHQEALRIFNDLHSRLEDRRVEASRRPKAAHVPQRPVSDGVGATGQEAAQNFGAAVTINVRPRTDVAKSATPTCRAMYTFVAENSTELAFEEGDVIQLIERVDDSWFEGELKGKRGFFPVNYVEVIVPLP